MSLQLKSTDVQTSKINPDKVHKTSLSSGKSSNAVFNVHSFNIGDVENEASNSIIEFKAYKVLMNQGKPVSEEVIGEIRV